MLNLKKLFNQEEQKNIIYEDGYVKKLVSTWKSYLKINNIKELFEIIGHNSDKIYLYQNYGELNTINYSNKPNDYQANNFLKIDFQKKEIILNNKSITKYYQINEDKSINPVPISIKNTLGDKQIFFRYKNNLHVIDYKNYELIFEVYLNEEINKNEEIENTLKKLVFPIDIIDTYKKLETILNLSKKDIISLSLTVTKNFNKKKADIITDAIIIENNSLQKVIRTKDNIRIILDNLDNWSYEKLEDERKISVSYRNNKYRYSFKSNNEEQYFTKEELRDTEEQANLEVKSVKTLIKNNITK